MDRYLERGSVISTADLTGKERLGVDFAGALITTQGTGCYGVVSKGRPAGVANEIILRGITEVYVDGGTAGISVNDPLTAGGGTVTDSDGATITGAFTQATIGTHPVRGYAMATVSANTGANIEVFVI